VAATLSLATVAGTASAANADELGIDVSRWQHGTSIDWADVRADGVRFAFIKATESSNYTNPYLASDWAATEQVGIYRGAYHFARPSVGSAVTQARYFVAKAGRHADAGDLPPVLDLESTGGLGVTELRTWAKTWLTTVEEMTGRKPVIYTSPYFWESSLGNSTAFTDYPLWIAHYGASSPRVPGGWPRWTFWQGTDKGLVNGISGYVDKNAFNGSLAQLKALANLEPVSEPEDPTPDLPPTPDQPDTTSRLATETTLALSKSSVLRGRPVTFSGQLRTDDGAAMPQRRVVLLRRADGSTTWTRMTSLTTDAAGDYSVTFTASAGATFKAVFRGNPTHRRSVSAVRELTISPKVQVAPTLAAERSSLRKGESTRLYGNLRSLAGAPLGDRTVHVYRRVTGTTTWTRIGDARTVSPTGWFQEYVRPTRTATYKVVFRGGTRFQRAASPLQTVTVR